jgi:Tfp pilus assembly protein PilF
VKGATVGHRLRGQAGAAAGCILLMVTSLCGQGSPELGAGLESLYQGHYVRARMLAEQYVQAHPKALPGWLLLARTEIAQGQYELAYQSLQKALDLDPASMDALYYLERVSTILSQLEFRRLIETAPQSMRAHQLMAESYLAGHHVAEAEKEYQAALQVDPASVEILNALGELMRSQFRFDEALVYYGRATRLAPRNYTSAYGMGACYLFKQDTRHAVESFRRALAIDGSSAAAHLALGDALLRDGQASAAIPELKTAARLVPDMRQAYALLARAYEKLGQRREAEEALQKEQSLAREEIRSARISGSDEETPPRPQ